MRNILNILPFRFPGPTVTMRRKYNKETYCISHLYYGKEDEYMCDAIEDCIRDTNHNGEFDGAETKVYGETAIPCGRYYVTFCKTRLTIGKKAKHGCIRYVHRVPSFTSIRIHPGETEKNSEGCIILGYNKAPGSVADSEEACLKFYNKLHYRPFWLVIIDDV